MQWLTRDSDGSVAIITLLAVSVLFAFAAIVIDVAALLQERRTLQNGADAAALAIAAQCGAAGDCSSLLALAETYADANADDAVSAIEDLCGSTDTGLAACADPPSLPAGASYVKVSTSTEAIDGTTIVPYSFARIFGLTGDTVHANAVVAWGGPAGFTAELPLTISVCEFNAYMDELGITDPDDLPLPPAGEPPDYTSYTEKTVYFHDTTDAQPCPSGPAGSDLPGGFGWLETEGECSATTTVDGWFDDKTGRPPPSDCTAAMMDALVGTTVHLPIFDQTNLLTGTNGQYHMASYASFYITGYSILGQYKEASLVTGQVSCSGQTSCLSGFFVYDPVSVEGTIGGPSNGVTVISLLS